MNGLCKLGLMLFITWGMRLVNITVFGDNSPKAMVAAESARADFEHHQGICPECKLLPVFEEGTVK